MQWKWKEMDTSPLLFSQLEVMQPPRFSFPPSLVLGDGTRGLISQKCFRSARHISVLLFIHSASTDKALHSTYVSIRT